MDRYHHITSTWEHYITLLLLWQQSRAQHPGFPAGGESESRGLLSARTARLDGGTQSETIRPSGDAQVSPQLQHDVGHTPTHPHQLVQYLNLT